MKFRVIGVGEVLWDMLPGGRKLGGAPANFTYHVAALGAEARLISRVGNDDAGREAVAQLAALGVRTDCIEMDQRLPTGNVTVELTEGQPRYIIHENAAWDALEGGSPAPRAAAEADGICFGTLGQRSERSRAAIQRLVSETPDSALRILDVNLRPPFISAEVIKESLTLANVLKLNETELPRLARFFGLQGELHDQIQQLSDRFELRCVAYTRGAQGSVLYAVGEWSEQPGLKTTVVDAVGAGDAFTAALTLGLLAEWPLDEINRRAGELGAYVCSQPGGMPQLPNYVRERFLTEDLNSKPLTKNSVKLESV